MLKQIEIMSPAGSFESLQAAIQGGANSIYFGIEQLNMRARAANNFTINDIPEINAICEEHNVKSYLALNTIIYDHDLSVMKSIIKSVKANNITAIIASDQAVINFAHSNDVPVHISTQVNITNIETVKFYSHFADVMVLARELSLTQIKTITDKIKKENITGPSGKLICIEIFIHGALCMAVSGKCYLSLHTNNASANRGACVQNCRRTYEVKDKKDGHVFEIDNEYIMSPKDLCTIGFIDEVLEAGVDVLKIEGRGRAPEYVYTVTHCYKKAVEAVKQGSFTQEKVKLWDEELKKVYNRGFWDGYYLGRKLGEWTKGYGSQATQQKKYVGKGVKYFPKIKVAECFLDAGALQVGDELLIIGPTTGIVKHRIVELRLSGKSVQKVVKGDDFSMPFPCTLRNSDKLYKIIAPL